MDSLKDARVMRLPEVITVVGMCRAQIYRKMNNGTFPQSVRISARAVAWRESEIIDWLTSRAPSKAAPTHGVGDP